MPRRGPLAAADCLGRRRMLTRVHHCSLAGAGPAVPASQACTRCRMSEAAWGVPLVVIGASAGGVEALAALVGTLRAPFPAPIVIAQHLDPTRPSHLGEILARR